MKKICCLFLALLVFLQGNFISVQAEQSPNGCKTLQASRPLSEEAYTGSANAVILYELNTQTLVYAHNPDVSVNPTGLIKLLTALLTLEEGNLDAVVTVKRSTLNSVAADAVTAGLKAGEEITLKDLLYCVMVSSANDAAAVIAEHLAGSQSAFVDKMNQRAATLGCVNTHFTNVHGLKDERQHSTARDLAIITEEALKNEQFRHFFAVTHYTVPATNSSAERNLVTTNYMMDPSRTYYDARVTGGKPAAASTTDRSMICTAAIEEAEYLCVVISAKARTSGGAVTRYTNFDETSKLLTMGFEAYGVQQVLGTEQPFGLYPVSDGENQVVITPDEAVYALLPVPFDASKLYFEDVADEKALHAPLAAGTNVGILRIYYDSVLIGQVNLLSCHGVNPVGMSIQTPDNTGSEIGGFHAILKWSGVFVLVFLVITGMALVIIRRKRIYRGQNGKHRKSGIPERSES